MGDIAWQRDDILKKPKKKKPYTDFFRVRFTIVSDMHHLSLSILICLIWAFVYTECEIKCRGLFWKQTNYRSCIYLRLIYTTRHKFWFNLNMIPFITWSTFLSWCCLYWCWLSGCWLSWCWLSWCWLSWC